MLNKNRSIFEGVYILAKFYLSKSPDGKMNCISRSLGKFSIVDRDYDGTINDQDIWVCKIVKEIQPRQNSGAFVLRPIERVDVDKVKKIIPGFYDAQPMGRAISIIPNTDPHDYWMLSKSTRKIFSRKYYAVVVPIAYKQKEEENDKKEKQIYRVEKPEMVHMDNYEQCIEPMQAKVVETGEVIKVYPMWDDRGNITFTCVSTRKVYERDQLEPVKIKTEQEVESAIAPYVSAKFSVSARVSI